MHLQVRLLGDMIVGDIKAIMDLTDQILLYMVLTTQHKIADEPYEASRKAISKIANFSSKSSIKMVMVQHLLMHREIAMLVTSAELIAYHDVS